MLVQKHEADLGEIRAKVLCKKSLKVRCDGPQPSVFVRSFSAITTFKPEEAQAGRRELGCRESEQTHP